VILKYKHIIKKLWGIIYANKGTFLLAAVLLSFFFFKDESSQFITNNFSKLDIFTFGFIYFFLAIFCLPTLPLSIIAGQLYETIPASFAITIPVTLAIFTQIIFPGTFGFGISSDQYIEKLSKKFLRLNKFKTMIILSIVRANPALPLPVYSALTLRVMKPTKKINLIISLISAFVGTFIIALITVLFVKISNIF
tara:strand:- start:1146 stop:1730 length:585 start_codon:yes stop_codon:yes gene_type:complete